MDIRVNQWLLKQAPWIIDVDTSSIVTVPVDNYNSLCLCQSIDVSTSLVL